MGWQPDARKTGKEKLKDSQARLEPLQVENNVTIPISGIDRVYVDPATLLGIVLNVIGDKY